MLVVNSKSDPRLIEALNNGGLAVIRTDTLYGVVARADNQAAVEKIYRIKGRDLNKPLIVLISDQTEMFNSANQDLSDKWPGRNSLIIDSPSAHDWLKRGGSSIAYRLPADETLTDLIRFTGPLVAPSANLQGQPPSTNIQQAVDYFGEQIDIYVDEGEVPADQPPSKLWKLNGDNWERLR